MAFVCYYLFNIKKPKKHHVMAEITIFLQEWFI